MARVLLWTPVPPRDQTAAVATAAPGYSRFSFDGPVFGQVLVTLGFSRLGSMSNMVGGVRQERMSGRESVLAEADGNRQTDDKQMAPSSSCAQNFQVNIYYLFVPGPL